MILPKPPDGQGLNLYHVANEAAARAIMGRGFVNHFYVTTSGSRELQGVLVSDDPLAAAAGVQADATVIVIEVPIERAELECFEMAEFETPRRCTVYCVPSSLLNTRGRTWLWTYLDDLIKRDSNVQFSEVARRKYATRSSQVMNGAACVIGTHVKVSVVLDSLADGESAEEILTDFPALTQEGIQNAIAYAADLVRERDAR